MRLINPENRNKRKNDEHFIVGLGDNIALYQMVGNDVLGRVFLTFDEFEAVVLIVRGEMRKRELMKIDDDNNVRRFETEHVK